MSGWYMGGGPAAKSGRVGVLGAVGRKGSGKVLGPRKLEPMAGWWVS